MTTEQLRRLLAAPELVVVDLVDSALDALRLAMFAEHPLLDDDDALDPPVQRRARTALRHARRLHRALDDYRRVVELVLREPPRDDIF